MVVFARGAELALPRLDVEGAVRYSLAYWMLVCCHSLRQEKAASETGAVHVLPGSFSVSGTKYRKSLRTAPLPVK